MGYVDTYNSVLDLIEKRLGTEAWYDAYNGSVDMFTRIANQAGVTINKSASGNIVGYVDKWSESIPTSEATQIAESINSNIQSGTAAVDNTIAAGSVIDTVAGETAGTVKTSSKLTKFTNGVKGVLNTPVAGKITPAIMAASAGVQLGKAIDGAIYNIGEVMGKDPPESLNPETWNDITQDMSDKGLSGVDKWAFNTILGLDPKSGQTTMYADENAFAYMTQYLNQLKFFVQGEDSIEKPQEIDDKNIPDSFIASRGGGAYNWGTPKPSPTYTKDGTAFFTESIYENNNPTYGKYYSNIFGITGAKSVSEGGSYLYGKRFSYRLLSAHNVFTSGTFPSINVDNYYQSTASFTNTTDKLAYMLLYGSSKKIGGVEGISDIPNAPSSLPSGLKTVLDNPSSTPKQVLDELKKDYPNLWNNRVENNVVQPDGSVKTYTYIPMPIPTGGLGNAPTTTGNTWNPTLNLPKITVAPTNKITPETDPYNKVQPATDTQLATIIKFITDPISKPQNMTDTIPSNPVKPDTPILNPTPNPNPPATGGGDTPSVTPPTGTASALYAIYNPTLSQINDFGAWLWSENFVDQIKKLFSDPMQAIIGLHKVYATPITGGSQNIKVGYLDSGVSSKVVTEQYTTINCGSVALSEYFGNVFDYSPYTTVNLYLPFIGIVSLDVADVMRSTLTITYHVDVLTGACLAEVRVKRDNAGGVLYQYSGNAAVTLPISSGSYMGIVTSLASAATGIVGTIASGGALSPMLIGAAGTALNARTNVEHSGSFSGNAGAMGGKIPYLIISRPQTELADNYENYVGNPSNTTTTLGSCSGYVQVKECHLEGIPATQSELERIESLLKGGVLI